MEGVKWPRVAARAIEHLLKRRLKSALESVQCYFISTLGTPCDSTGPIASIPPGSQTTPLQRLALHEAAASCASSSAAVNAQRNEVKSDAHVSMSVQRRTGTSTLSKRAYGDAEHR